MRDGGDELILQRVQLGALRELKRVLMVLFACLGELLCEFARGALRSQEGKKQNTRGCEKREITK